LLAEKVSTGVDLDRYGYGECPLREEIIQPLPSYSGSELSVVTRNVYGALVLNTTNTMFVCIDFPEKTLAVH
jgi:hypothetical protein